MNILSEEQTEILKYIKNGKNVVVDSCAGTGKTTLILSVAKALPNKKILQMTYNSMLRYEVKDRVKKSKIENMKVHTFHSLAVKYYLPTCFTDTGIRYILLKDIQPLKKLPKFDIFVLDEAQDMTFIYFQFMAKFARDTCYPIQLLILGDYMQGLYDFKGADIRFLTLADIIWEHFDGLKTKEFKKCTLRLSYRITNSMRSFVNNVMLGSERMDSCKDGPPVTYIRNSRQSMEKIVAAEILKLFDEGYQPSDIFVLGPSVKGANSNIRQLENILVERGIPCHVPMLENDKIDERVIDKKVVFSTFHCVKGRERKIVFILGFDNSYFRCYARNLPKELCPNTLYVAATRATERVYFLESDSYRTDRPLDFLQMSHIEMKQQDYINFKGQHQTLFIDEENSVCSQLITKHFLTPTELIKFIPDYVIEEISLILDRIFIKSSGELEELEIPSIIETKHGFFEEVSDLNGIAIPCIYYDYLCKGSQTSNVLLKIIKQNIDTMRINEHLYLKEIVNTLPENIDNISDYLFLANISVAVQETLYFKLKQIYRDEYNWLSEDILNECKLRLDNFIGNECSQQPIIEETIIHSSDDDSHKNIDNFLMNFFEPNVCFRFTARVDLITDSTVWELKCTSKISFEHLLQVIIYAWLWNMKFLNNKKQFKIFNIRTKELLSLDASQDDLNTIILALLKGKFSKQETKLDEEFINDCKLFFNKSQKTIDDELNFEELGAVLIDFH
jgi:hypothetical protein